MPFIDTHTHLFLDEFESDLPAVVQRAVNAGVSYLIMPNVDAETSEALIRVYHQYPNLMRCATGLHPTSVAENWKETVDRIINQFADIKIVAIGEIGIDLYWDKTKLHLQQEAFAYQLRLANSMNLPVIIHSRDAHNEIISILDNLGEKLPQGVFHCFTGTAGQAQQILDRGLYIGIGGVVTFKKSDLGETLSKAVPLEKIVLETDAPYLTPAPFRGKRNEPEYLTFTIQKLAEIYGKSTTEIEQITSLNATKLFDIK
jgi:TatD DNase family protein